MTVPVILGPTASGKSALALMLARTVASVEIISADSRQVYHGMDIGTAKPSVAERRAVPHHLIDILNPDEAFSAGDFAQRAAQLIRDISRRGGIPIVVGGTAFYLRALFQGLGAPVVDPLVYRWLEERVESDGYELLVDELRHVDPVAAEAHPPENRIKTLRALCCYHQTGRPYSSFIDSASALDPGFEPDYLAIVPQRQELYERINRRVVKMIDDGLIEECRYLRDRGYQRRCPGLMTVGYSEVFAMFAGEIGSQRMIELIQQNTRRYAKRQMTWIRGMQGRGDAIRVVDSGTIEQGLELLRNSHG